MQRLRIILLNQMNNTIFYLFYNLAHQSNFFDHIVVFFSVYFPYIVIGLAGLFLLFHHDILKSENPYQVFLEKKKEILKVFLPALCAVLIGLILKFLIAAPRPFVALQNVYALFPETGYAFPSGHATFFSALAVSLFFYNKKAGYIFMFFALVIGLSRIIAGVHFPIDILSGFVLGAGAAYLLKNVYPHTYF